MSLGANSNEYIKSLINTGADAMQNLYFAEFTGKAIENSGLGTSLKIRLQDFTSPEFTQSTNEVSFMTVSAKMPGAGIDGTKSLSLTFRLDNNYRLYEFLLKQQSPTMVANSGWATNQVTSDKDSEGALNITLKAFDRSTGKTPEDDEGYSTLYTFKYCWIKGISGLSYSYDNANPMTIKVDIVFLDYEDPMGLLHKTV